jgi:hypothetical protein
LGLAIGGGFIQGRSPIKTSKYHLQFIHDASDCIEQKGKGNIDEDVELEEWKDIEENDPVQVCISRWRNAGPDVRKRIFQMFDESGLFLCACRHGIVLLMCDMIRSGELYGFYFYVLTYTLMVPIEESTLLPSSTNYLMCSVAAGSLVATTSLVPFGQH